MEKKRASFVTAGLLLGIFAAAVDNTIVATAMGTIVGDLGNYDQFIWVTAAYMVAMMAGMPIYGKLSDMYGRKRFFLFGLVVFIVGSALCGLSQSMGQLIAFRVIQGIGGGALMPIAFTIIFDLFPPEKRGKMTGLLGAVFGLSSVVGPLLGAFLTDTFSWHWIFYVNLPIGIVSIFFIAKYYKETLEHRKQKIDWAGAFTLVLAIVCFMFALELGGGKYAWDSAVIISLIAVAVVSFIIFIFVETKAEEPIIPFWMFKKRLFAASQALAFIYGATFIILSVFIPIFVQAVYGGSATNAGIVLMPMVIGTVIGSMISGITQSKVRFRTLMIFSVFSFLIGMILLSTMTPDTTRLVLTIYMFIAGFGVGFSFSLLPTASINNLSPRFRGTANSTNSFLRSFGMTVGLTIFGTVQTHSFTKRLSEAFGGNSTGFGGGEMNTREIFTPEGRAKIPPEVLDKITQAMSDSITHVFQIAIIPIAIAVVVVFLMGKERAQTSSTIEMKESA
ncbi:MDR family MFS transporter [Paenibacillus sp. Marseille-Q4541]|uniref:MDR family MFS transporter n=1 Tax=Paenibacillus sp. Marseille-Q4541 TaxID=2831522 RepID=UPI001BA87D5C|nr:MDR family MFS transporter [Paenibacillus sp. Marseille-Q4541]